MTICLITRTQPGAQVTQAVLASLGYQPIVAPAANIVATGATVATEGVQALLMTSAAAARSVQLTAHLAALPVYAVGDATADAATHAGFTNVISAGGDGATLAVLAADRMKTDAGALLHLRGQEVAGDVTGMLSACGFETRNIEVYHTYDHPDFRNDIRLHLSGHSGLVIVHSPAGARRLYDAIVDLKLDLKDWEVVGLSPACLTPVHDIGFAQLISAAQPDESALIEAISLHATHSRT